LTSPAKLTANRRNGAKSRGPQSTAGKARAARNRFLYTIDARNFVAPGEDAAAFRALAKMALEAWQPQTRFERLLVHRLCGQLWQRDRLLRVERAVLGDAAAAQQVPERVRECLAKGPLDQLAKLHELQIALDGAVHQSMALLTELTDRQPTRAWAGDADREEVGQVPPAPLPRPQTAAVPTQPSPSRPFAEEDAPAEAQMTRRRFSMAPPLIQFGKKRRRPSGA
jgi:hypothetical protein